jgi:hypothetical protein
MEVHKGLHGPEFVKFKKTMDKHFVRVYNGVFEEIEYPNMKQSVFFNTLS